MAVRNRFAELLPEITGWRRDLHAHPELLFDVPRTAAFVAGKLRDFGCDEVVEGIGMSGVVGVITGRSTASGRVVGLRADMDALPIAEATGAGYASTVPGTMHACGHDGHTAMLLGAARYLSETRAFDGTVVAIFQPAEEGGGGGRVMVEDGLIERFGIREVYGMHNWPGLEEGAFAIRAGTFFASTDEIDIVVHGQGGHAAKPHDCVDPVVAAAHVVAALQSVVSRDADPAENLVISVTSIESSSRTHNVIPASVMLKGTIRALREPVRRLAAERVATVAEATAAAFGARAEVRIIPGYPPMVNAEIETRHAEAAARRVVGTCGEAATTMGGEDFAYMLNACPGAYILLGIGASPPLHHPRYDFNDDAIPYGCSFWVELAEGRLPLTE